MTDSDTQIRLTALDPTRSFCVTAPAGSGKTELLTQRILALLPTVDRPEQVLAMTFTRKAAAEMRERLLSKLDEARRRVEVTKSYERQTRDLALAVLAHADERNWSLDPEEFNLRTIDSLCADLTRQMPILSGLGGAVEITDQDKPLFEQAIIALFDAVGSEAQVGEDLRCLLLHFNNDWDALRELLVALLARRGDWGRSLGQHADPAEAARALQATVEALIQSVVDRLCKSFESCFEELQQLSQLSADELGQPDVHLGADYQALASWQYASHILLTGAGEWRKPGGVNVKLGFPAKSEAKARLQSLLNSLSESPVPSELLELRALPVVSDEDISWGLVLRLSRLLPVLQAQLLLVFQREGRVDFTHVALAAQQALGADEEPTDLALRLDYQIVHILVDEFQDTSNQQFELLKKLMRGWHEHNATGASPRTAFIVGDGMQSIYGFRYADVGLFLQAKARGIGGLPLESLELTQNFRSQAGVVDWVNRVFAEVFPKVNDAERSEVSHTRAVPVNAALPGNAVEAHLFPDDAGLTEANWIAEKVAQIYQSEPDATIAVLMRARSHAAPIIAALQQHDLPFLGRDLEKIQHSAAVMDLLSLCRWLSNPADEVAALALLRAPFCGVLLSEIYPLIEDQPRPFSLRSVLRRAAEQLDANGATRAGSLEAALDWAETRRDRLSLRVWVEQTWLQLHGASTLSKQGIADAMSFFDLLARADAEGIGLDPDWLERALDQRYASHDHGQSGVELMTLHKAKGLQFDYVFMPALHKGTRGNQRALLRWHFHGQAGQGRLLIAADDRQKNGSTLYNYLNWLQKGKEAAELRRLLYVGVTRARCRVWLSGLGRTDSADGSRLTWPGSASPFGILREALSGEAVEHTASITAAPLEEKNSGTAPSLSTCPLWRLPLTNFAVQKPGDGEQASIPRQQGIQGEQSALIQPAGHFTERIVGVVVHRALELLSQRDVLPSGVDTTIRRGLQFGLIDSGLDGDSLTQSLVIAEAMIAATLNDDRGRWILSQRSGAYSELLLMSPGVNGALAQHIIDRTFLDPETGCRWIIDYKTSRPNESESEQQFLARESQHYSTQLARYRTLVEAFDPAASTVKTALYFPADSLWLCIEDAA
ncbi:MAG: UvrD-helicase domain-containing protein [Luminiphilus sp.]|nr:UvrD-helicase domain-containing protein [Luminiphilus sp.]